MSSKISILQYNVLSAEYCLPRFFPGSDRFLSWETRSKMICEEIELFKTPDILCIQEMHESIFPSFLKMLPHEKGECLYEGKMEKKVRETLPKVENMYHPQETWKWDDGCAIVWNSHVFELVDNYVVDYTDSIESSIFKEHYDDLARKTHNLGMGCLLKHTNSDRMIWVTTTHILYDRRKPNIQYYQVYTWMDELTKRNSELGYPFIATGDLNTNFTNQNEIIRFVEAGEGEILGKSISHGFGLDSSKSEGLVIQRVDISSKKEMNRYYMPFTERNGRTLDYIFHSKSLALTDFKSTMTEEEKKMDKLVVPNEHHPSDHFPLYCEFLW